VCPCHIIRDRRFGHFRIAFRGRYSPGARTGPEHVSESDERRRWASDLRKLLPSARSGQWATTTVFSSHTPHHRGLETPARPAGPPHQPDLIIPEAPAVVSPLSAGLLTARGFRRTNPPCPTTGTASPRPCLVFVVRVHVLLPTSIRKASRYKDSVPWSLAFRPSLLLLPFHCIARLVPGDRN
jgi:hypothetical protein